MRQTKTPYPMTDIARRAILDAHGLSARRPRHRGWRALCVRMVPWRIRW
ncbi:MAG TPA: hypothetical protein VEM59_10840 [Acidimicrobiia bacterium]|nr:hypothetical protein [Acidimicrobiia bacterium]